MSQSRSIFQNLPSFVLYKEVKHIKKKEKRFSFLFIDRYRKKNYKNKIKKSKQISETIRDEPEKDRGVLL